MQLGCLIVLRGYQFDKWHDLFAGQGSAILIHSLIFLAFCMISGYIIEDLGSRWEIKFCKAKIAEWIEEDKDGVNAQIKNANRKMNGSQIYAFGWERFLALDYDAEKSNGHRFLRYMLERLKFELNTGFVFYIIFILGVAESLYTVVFYEGSTFDLFKVFIILFSWSIARFLLTKEAPASAISLHETRLILILKFDKKWTDELNIFNKYEGEMNQNSQKKTELKKGITIKQLVFNFSNWLGKVRSILFLFSLGLISRIISLIKTFEWSDKKL